MRDDGNQGDPTGTNPATGSENNEQSWGLTEGQRAQTDKQRQMYREQTAPQPLKVRIGDRELDLEIDPFVANPNIMNSSWQTVNFLQEHPEFVRGQDVCDMGTGSGILGLTAAELGANRVYMPDIEQRAVTCAQKNIVKNHLDGVCETFQSDLFENFPADQPKPKVHIFNHPFFPAEPDEEEEWTDMMFGTEGLVDRYLEEVKLFSGEDAVVIMPWFTLANRADGRDNDPRHHVGDHGFEFEEFHQAPVSQGVQQAEFIIYVLRPKKVETGGQSV